MGCDPELALGPDHPVPEAVQLPAGKTWLEDQLIVAELPTTITGLGETEMLINTSISFSQV